MGRLFEDTLLGVCLENLYAVVYLSILNCGYVWLLWVLLRSVGLVEALGGHWMAWLELLCIELPSVMLGIERVPPARVAHTVNP